MILTHSLVLSLSSRWFREMFTLPQRPLTEYELGRPSKTGVPETISVSEPAKVLAGVLGVVSGQPLPSLHDIDYVDDLLRAAEKYEMQSVISLVRVAVMMSGFLKTRSVRVYGIASSRGWAEEAQIACEGGRHSGLIIKRERSCAGGPGEGGFRASYTAAGAATPTTREVSGGAEHGYLRGTQTVLFKLRRLGTGRIIVYCEGGVVGAGSDSTKYRRPFKATAAV